MNGVVKDTGVITDAVNREEYAARATSVNQTKKQQEGILDIGYVL